MSDDFLKEPDDDRTALAIRFGALFLLILVIIGLVSCTNPEAEKRKREQLLSKFCTGVAKHIFDRNPVTVRESMTHLFREELTEAVIEKLQKEGSLPKTELGIVKIITEAEEQRTTNAVTVSAVKPLGPVEKDIVPFQVTGKVTTKTEGKPDQDKPFSIKIVCKLNEQTGGWPQVVDLTGLTPQTKPAPAKEPAAKKKVRKRRL
ncbi:MAG TPA: hypothetical protein V6D08_03790 [Candidatus Obscuribacterales bacterium]